MIIILVYTDGPVVNHNIIILLTLPYTNAQNMVRSMYVSHR
jgi:hypothetical protein